MQVTSFISITALLLSSASATCFKTGAKWPGIGDPVNSLDGVCDKSKGHYDASEAYSVCINGEDGIRYNFEIRNTSGGPLDLSANECIGGLSKEIVNCPRGGESSSGNWRYRDARGRGYELTFESPKAEKLSLFRHGDLGYDHLILTPPKSKGYGPSLTPKLLLDFTNAGGNVLLALSANTPTPAAISSLLLELDLHLSPDRTSLVVDHFNYDLTSSAEKHDVLVLPRPGPLRPDLKNYFGGDGILAIPQAIGQTLGPNSPLLAPILSAPETAYSYNPKDEAESVEETPFATGGQLALISAMQARNSARFTVLGSLDMLSNKWFGASVKAASGEGKVAVKTVNREFAKQLTAWTFKEVGVLKVHNIEHHLSNSDDIVSGSKNTTQLGLLNPEIYRIKNDVTYSITLSEYSHTHLIPFALPSPNDALQLEVAMLSPFHRLPLTPAPSSSSPNTTTFTATFTLPDQHGIFAFKVNYKRPFLTNIEEKRTVTVRHFAHDEWPRSWKISGGWVWIAGLWSVVGGWVAFVAVWLYAEPKGGR
ncbi:MAG: hypothetical protein Q9160_003962 [Pyrenula sp. 1 TL-2023]